MIRLEFDGRLACDEILRKAREISAGYDLPIHESGNYLIKSENFTALSVLLKYYCGKIDLVYTDPPFNTMQDFYISSSRANSVSAVKSRRAYSDKMPPKNFHRSAWGNERDMILFYVKPRGFNIWNDIKAPLNESDIARLYPKIDSHGRHYTTIPLHAPGETHGVTGQAWRNIPVPHGRHWRTDPAEFDRLDSLGLIEWSASGNPRIKKYADEHEGRKIQDVWTFKDPQNPIYPTEKNHDMLKLIVAQSSLLGSITLDPFAGSGAFLSCAHEIGRKFIGIDQSEEAVRVIQGRLKGRYMFMDMSYSDYNHEEISHGIG